MEYVNALFYGTFLAGAVMLAGFNSIYSFRVHNTHYKLGIGTPTLLKRAIRLNAVISILGSLVIAFVFTIALLSLKIPALL